MPEEAKVRIWRMIARFVAGGILTNITYYVIFLALQNMGMHLWLATTLGYFIAVGVSFIMNRFFVFREQSRETEMKRTAGRFILYFIFSGILQSSLNWALISLGVNSLVAFAVSGLTLAIVNFLVMKNSIFVRRYEGTKA